jgi:hypothetical protein
MTSTFLKGKHVPELVPELDPKPPPAESQTVDSADNKESPGESPADEPNQESAQQETAFKKLRRAVGKEVSNRSAKIAKSLVDHTIKGNSNSARIVVGLVDKRRRSKSEMNKLKEAALNPKPGRSVAIDLASDPPWKDEEIDHSVGEPAVSDEERRDDNEAHKK